MYLRVEGIRSDDLRVVGVERFERVALVVVAVVVAERRLRRKGDGGESGEE